MLFVFNNYHETKIIKRVWYRHENKHIHQWKRTEYSKTDVNIYSQLTFGKDSKVIQWERRKVISKNGYYNNWVSVWEKKINLNHCFKTYIKIITKQNKNFNLTLHTKSNTKWITELSVKPNYKISRKK